MAYRLTGVRRHEVFRMIRSDTGLSFMKVGLISLPPFARAATAMLACRGVTAIPWPKETVCRGHLAPGEAAAVRRSPAARSAS